MYKTEFLNILKSDERIKLNDFAVEKLKGFLEQIDNTKPQDNGLLQSFITKLSTYPKARIYTNDFYELLLTCITEQAQFEATQHKIKDFKGTRYEELELLKHFFTKERLKVLHLNFIKDEGISYAEV